MSGATTLLMGPDSTRKMGSVGQPMLGVELRVVDDDLSDVPADDVGEVVYRGSERDGGLPRAAGGDAGGVRRASGSTAVTWRRFDEEGYLWLVDRKKDMIISGGENVYPAEVERVLLDHPAVAEAAVIGVPHPRWVETPVAFIVPRGPAEPGEGELIAHCRQYLAGYKKPSAIILVQELPRNAAGKVLKRHLRETYSDQFSAVME